MAKKEIEPEITGTYFRHLQEDSHDNVAGGDLDVKNGADLFQAVNNLSGQFGTFNMNEYGEWSYVLDNSREATQALEHGERKSDWFFAKSADGTLSQLVLVVVHGTKDPEVTLVGVPDF
jgi:VCBS repeat-containing protein